MKGKVKKMKKKNFQPHKFSPNCFHIHNIRILNLSWIQIFYWFSYSVFCSSVSVLFLHVIDDFFCRQTERSKEMDFAAGCTSAIFFKRNEVNIKLKTYLNSAKGEDFKYIRFDMLKITEDNDAIFHLHFSSFSFINFTKICCSNFSSLLWLSKNTKFISKE